VIITLEHTHTHTHTHTHAHTHTTAAIAVVWIGQVLLPLLLLVTSILGQISLP